jgi:hypothetical protein
MSTTFANRPSIPRRHRRTLLSVAIVAAVALGGGVAAVNLTSSDGSTSSHTSSAVSAGTNVDVHALWNELAAMPRSERDNIAAGLSPTVRAQLHATAEAVAVAAEPH